MKVVEQHVSRKVQPLSARISGLAIPWRRAALYLILCSGFFLLGFIPSSLEMGKALEQRDAAQREARLGRLENKLGTAVMEVQRGQYEPARQTMNDFYTNLRGQIEAGSNSVFVPAQREELLPILNERNEVITLLARSDPSAADRLLAIYSSYRRMAK